MTLQLGDKAIFAAGDMEHGPSSAVYAMASGRRAATSIIRLLAGQDMFYGRQYAGPYVDDFTVDTGNAVAIPRQTGLGHFCTGTGDFTETTQYLTEQEARDEASRCLSCGGPTGTTGTAGSVCLVKWNVLNRLCTSIFPIFFANSKSDLVRLA